MKNNNLIFGKNPTERIVSLEINDNNVSIYTRNIDGIISTDTKPNRFWILSSSPKDKSWIKLKGNLHYQFGKQFQNREEFIKFRNIYKHKDIFSIYNEKESLMVKDGYCQYKGMRVDDLHVLSFDIESTSLEHSDKAKVLLISNTFRKNGVITRKLFSYDDYETDKQFLDAWCSWVRNMDPDVIIAHNGIVYDFPYLNYIAQKAGTELLLGRDGSKIKFAEYTSQFRKDGSQSYPYNKVSIYGREIVDTFFLSIKYDVGRKYESYKLKQIIKQEGLERTNRTFYDAATIKDNYKDPIEFEKIKQYCREDSDDALALYDLMIPSFFYWTQSIPKSFQSVIESASGSQLNSLLMRSYLQEMHSLPAPDEAEPFEGAISFGIPGSYSNALRFDFSAMYPSIILTYGIFPETKDPNKNFLAITKYFTDERLKNKKLAKETGSRYYDDLQSTAKIGINSLYGAMGAPGLNFNYPKGASEVTKKGRELLSFCIEWATGNTINKYEEYIKRKE